MEDLFALDSLGIKGALVATAIHSGSVPPEVMTLGLKKVKSSDS
jgi:phosphoribosylformimino-5-aminoimidazole carboxamide ribotide isomerase